EALFFDTTVFEAELQQPLVERLALLCLAPGVNKHAAQLSVGFTDCLLEPCLLAPERNQALVEVVNFDRQFLGDIRQTVQFIAQAIPGFGCRLYGEEGKLRGHDACRFLTRLPGARCSRHRRFGLNSFIRAEIRTLNTVPQSGHWLRHEFNSTSLPLRL